MFLLSHPITPIPGQAPSSFSVSHPNFTTFLTHISSYTTAEWPELPGAFEKTNHKFKLVKYISPQSNSLLASFHMHTYCSSSGNATEFPCYLDLPHFTNTRLQAECGNNTIAHRSDGIL